MDHAVATEEMIASLIQILWEPRIWANTEKAAVEHGRDCALDHLQRRSLGLRAHRLPERAAHERVASGAPARAATPVAVIGGLDLWRYEDLAKFATADINCSRGSADINCLARRILLGSAEILVHQVFRVAGPGL